MTRTVRILGTHGVPAAYGGFETAAEQIGLYLVDHGWRVVVYCQAEGRGPITYDTWRGIERVTIPQHREGWLGTSAFDWTSINHAIQHDDVCLTFGYNTGVFNLLQRVKRIPNVINMDGMEWTRRRWGVVRQAILLANERFASLFGNHLIADHPDIERYLARWARRSRISMITYGAHAVTDASPAPVEAMGLQPGGYLTVICRPIPENSLLEIVQGFSAKRRGRTLVVLGNLDGATDDYHRQVLEAASDEVRFPGAIYDPAIVQSLRFHSLAYVHGHTVGGTNPSLVEAMAAGNPVIAHDNVYNRWVAGPDQRYFTTADDLSALLDELLAAPDGDRAADALPTEVLPADALPADALPANVLPADVLHQMHDASRRRHAEEFTWEHVAGQYEAVLARFHAKLMHRA